MTLQDVRDRLEDVRASAGDAEAAHGMLDELYLNVLTAISLGQCKDAPPEDFAALVLEGEQIDFPRWFA
jgi:hypothetical protein